VKNLPTTQVDEDAFEMIWHSHYHDGPLTGLAHMHDRLCWFSYDHKTGKYDITPPRGFKKLKAIARKQWFEICVGKHCSYPPGKVFSSRKGQWFWRELANLYYGKRHFKARPKKQQ